MTVIDTPPFPGVQRPVFNVTDYGADITGVADSSIAIQNAWNAAKTAGGGKVFIPPGTFKVATRINISGTFIILEGVGYRSKLVSVSNDVLFISGDFQQSVIRDLWLDANGGAGINLNTGFLCNQNRFSNIRITVEGNTSCIASTSGLLWIDMLVDNCWFENGAVGNTVAMVNLQGGDGTINRNTFISCRFTANASTTWAVQIANNGAASFCFDDTFMDINFEIPNGGCMKFFGETGCRLENVTVYDLSGPTTKDLFVFTTAVGGAQRSVHGVLINVHRRGGTLGGGFFDIKMLAADLMTVINPAASNTTLGLDLSGSFNQLISADPTQTANLVLGTHGFGVVQVVGLDNRSGITAADGAPIILYTVQAGAGHLFDAAIEIDATAFTSGTATYTMTYTENGVSQTIVVTATVLNVVTGVRRLIQPDPSTNVTVQLTGAFVATCRLSAALMQLA